MQTSAKQVAQDTTNQIEQQFFTVLSQQSTPEQMKTFLDAFLSETEQTVLCKRFAILKLLSEGKSYTVIEESLKVSSATISSVSKLLQDTAIQALLKDMEAEEWADNMSSKFFNKLPGFLKKKEPKTEMPVAVEETAPVSENPASESPQTV